MKRRNRPADERWSDTVHRLTMLTSAINLTSRERRFVMLLTSENGVNQKNVRNADRLFIRWRQTTMMEQTKEKEWEMKMSVSLSFKRSFSQFHWTFATGLLLRLYNRETYTMSIATSETASFESLQHEAVRDHLPSSFLCSSRCFSLKASSSSSNSLLSFLGVFLDEN